MDINQAQIFSKALRKLGGTGKIAIVQVEKDKFFPTVWIGAMESYRIDISYDLVLEFGWFSFTFPLDEQVEAFIDAKKYELVIWDRQTAPERTITFKPILEEWDDENWITFTKELEEAKNE